MNEPQAVAALPLLTDGGSRPLFFEFDDGVTRLVKWHRPGQRDAFNELVAGRLGRLIGSPVLRGQLVHVPAALLPTHRQPHPGLHFGIARMPGRNFDPNADYPAIDNAGELAAAAVHLAWLEVADHAVRNCFLEIPPPREGDNPCLIRHLFRLVDFQHIFGQAWSTRPDPPRDWWKLPAHLLWRFAAGDLAVALDRLEALAACDILECFDGIPAEWEVDVNRAVELALAGKRAARFRLGA